MNRNILIYLSLLLLHFFGVASPYAVVDHNAIVALPATPILVASKSNIHPVDSKFNEADKCLIQSSIFLFEVEEDDERTNKATSFAPVPCIKISESNGRLLSLIVESYSISSDSRYPYSTQRYITFRSFRV